mgnify:CR=1 FL=1
MIRWYNYIAASIIAIVAVIAFIVGVIEISKFVSWVGMLLK